MLNYLCPSIFVWTCAAGLGIQNATQPSPVLNASQPPPPGPAKNAYVAPLAMKSPTATQPSTELPVLPPGAASTQQTSAAVTAASTLVSSSSPLPAAVKPVVEPTKQNSLPVPSKGRSPSKVTSLEQFICDTWKNCYPGRWTNEPVHRNGIFLCYILYDR